MAGDDDTLTKHSAASHFARWWGEVPDGLGRGLEQRVVTPSRSILTSAAVLLSEGDVIGLDLRFAMDRRAGCVEGLLQRARRSAGALSFALRQHGNQTKIALLPNPTQTRAS